MMKLFKLCLTVFIVIYYTTAESDVDSASPTDKKEKHDKKIFIPTDDWQELEEYDDRPLPTGLHYRMNLATGKTEVKLIESYKPKEALAVLPSENEGNEDAKNEKSVSDLKERLKKIPADEIATTTEDTNDFRTYEQLKKDFKDMNMAVKTDPELINELFEKYRQLTEKQKVTGSDNEEKILITLMDFEYLLHQIDNANDFSKNRGFQRVVFPALNSTSPKIRAEAARVLGSAVQSNVKAQISALEGGTVGILLRMLALDPSPEVQSSVFYALSCLVRKFPAAQQAFVNEGGVTVLSSLFSGESSNQLKLQVKVVTFINDLMVERQDAEDILAEAVNSSYTINSTIKDVLVKEAEERIRQYQLANLETKLREQHWCENLHGLLLKEVPHDINMSGPTFQPDHDVVEKVSAAMLSHIKTCRNYFRRDRTVVTILNNLIRYYKNLSLYQDGSDETDEYFTDLSKQLEKLSNQCSGAIGLQPLNDTSWQDTDKAENSRITQSDIAMVVILLSGFLLMICMKFSKKCFRKYHKTETWVF